MPSLPPTACACGKRLAFGQRCTCTQPSRDPERVRARNAAFDANRPTAAQRGYDAAWKKCRSLFLAQNPTCVHPDCRQPATDVDHIISIRDRPDLRLSWSNLRPFCHSHHSARTARDQGFARPGRNSPPPADAVPKLRYGHFPLSITLVCGPPASGKTSYVKSQARTGDLIIDLDSIAAALCLSQPHLQSIDVLPFAWEARDALYARIAGGSKKPGQRAWIICGGARAEDRRRVVQATGGRPVSTVMLFINASECVLRLSRDHDPRPRSEMVAAIEAWHRNYEPDPLAETINLSQSMP